MSHVSPKKAVKKLAKIKNMKGIHVFRNHKRKQRIHLIREWVFYGQLAVAVGLFIREMYISGSILSEANGVDDLDLIVIHYFRFFLLGFIIPLSLLNTVLFRLGWVTDVEKEVYEVSTYVVWVVLFMMHVALKT